MKISVLSDLHFGYAYNSELENDCFENAEEAIEKALDSDLIIFGGDIFDIRAPKTTTWGKALSILSKPLLKENTGIKLVETDKQMKEISKRSLNHIPVIAVAGNHERLTKSEVNTVEALENAGLVIHLHLNKIIFEKDGVKIAIHGMSSVPERYAKDVLEKWNPKPVEGCVNILLMHQSIDPYVYSPLEPPSLTLSNLPRGFDIIINGHLHGHNIEKLDGTILMMPGSTVVTQFEKNEAVTEKVIGRITIENEITTEFVPLENARKFYYEELPIDQSSLTLREQVERRLTQILYEGNHNKKPIIRMKLKGKDTNISDQDLRVTENKLSDKAVLILVKELESPEITEKRELLQNLRNQKLSIEEMGLNLLRKNLDELDAEKEFDYDALFHLLSEDQSDTALNILMGEQTTLQTLR